MRMDAMAKAAALIAAEIAELNERKAMCDHCGLNRYEDMDEHHWGESMRAALQRVNKQRELLGERLRLLTKGGA
jgi:hypothetical protein